jgi:hypothetical protein
MVEVGDNVNIVDFCEAREKQSVKRSKKVTALPTVVKGMLSMIVKIAGRKKKLVVNEMVRQH